jgi:hypothetical protein
VKPTFKPTLGGGGGVPTAFKPTLGGGKVPTSYKPIVTKKPLVGLSDEELDTAGQ